MKIPVAVSLLALFIYCTYGKQVLFKDCGSKGGTVNYVDVAGCENEPCIFKQGTNASVTVNFTASEDTSSITSKVYGIIGPTKVPFPGGVPVPNCGSQNPNCVMKSGVTVLYYDYLSVKKEFPEIKLIAQWEVLDANNNMLFCFMIPVEVKS